VDYWPQSARKCAVLADKLRASPVDDARDVVARAADDAREGDAIAPLIRFSRNRFVPE